MVLKYEALLQEMEIVHMLVVQKLEGFSDSKLVVYKVLDQYKDKDERMGAYLT